MFQEAIARERRIRIGRSLDQHSQEIVAIERKLERPDLPLIKRNRLLLRAPVVRGKIHELCGCLQVG